MHTSADKCTSGITPLVEHQGRAGGVRSPPTRQWLFGLSLLLTFIPISYYFTHGHLTSSAVRDALWDAAFDWSLAAALWFVYFARLAWRTAALVCGISCTLIPIPFVFQFVFTKAPGLRVNFAEAIIIWITAAFIWIGYFRRRHR